MKRIQFEYWHVKADLRERSIATEPWLEADFEHRDSAVLAAEWAAQVRFEVVTARKDASEVAITRSEYQGIKRSECRGGGRFRTELNFTGTMSS